LYVNARLGGPLTGDVPADVPTPAGTGTAFDVSGDEDIPFAWREVMERGQRTEHNPFA
jgi:hypothetical protein